MSYYKIKYEFMGQDSAGLRGGEVQFQVIKEHTPTHRAEEGHSPESTTRIEEGRVVENHPHCIFALC